VNFAISLLKYFPNSFTNGRNVTISYLPEVERTEVIMTSKESWKFWKKSVQNTCAGNRTDTCVALIIFYSCLLQAEDASEIFLAWLILLLHSITDLNEVFHDRTGSFIYFSRWWKSSVLFNSSGRNMLYSATKYVNLMVFDERLVIYVFQNISFTVISTP
jgi:hypothetical protein